MHGSPRITLWLVSAATALLLIDVTAVYVALPSMRDDLGASFAELQWVVDAYALTLAATLLTAGVLADRHGRRRAFLAGLAVFGVASAACALAPSAVALDLFRAVQGIGAAALFASALPLLSEAFGPQERGRALGVWGAVTGAALAVGPVVGGALVEGPGWRWVFAVNVPVVVVVGALAARHVRESHGARPARPDFAGMALLSAATGLLVLGLVEGERAGWGSAGVLGAFAASVVLVAVWAVQARRAADPVLDLGLLRDRAVAGTVLVAFGQSLALYPQFLFLAIVFQGALGAGALEAGLWLLPATLALLVVAPLSGRLTGRLPARGQLTAGLLLIAAAMLAMRVADPLATWTALLPGLVLGGIAIGVISPALAAAMITVLPAERTGLASGLANTARQLGIAVGVAGFGAVFQHVAAPQGLAAALDAVLLCAAVAALATAVAAWPLLRPAVGANPAWEAP